MTDWWSALGETGQIFACIAIPATVMLLIQLVMTFIGLGGDADAETLYLLDTYKNKEKLEEVLYEIIPTIRLMEFNSSKVDRKYCIKTFNGSIDTILPVIKRVAN